MLSKTLKSVLNFFFFFSQERDNRVFLAMMNRVLDTPGFYYSYTYDLTHTRQRIKNMTNQNPDFVFQPFFSRVRNCYALFILSVWQSNYPFSHPHFWIVCPSNYQCLNPFNHPSIHSSINLCIHSSSHPFIHPFIHPSIHLSIHSSFIYPSIHPSIHSTIHSSIHLTIHSFFHWSILHCPIYIHSMWNIIYYYFPFFHDLIGWWTFCMELTSINRLCSTTRTKEISHTTNAWIY